MTNIIIPEKDTPKLLMVVLFLTSSLCIGTCAMLTVALNNRSLATMDRTYVQMADGSAQDIVQVDPLHREPEVIKATAESFIKLMFEWDNKLPSGQDDSGVEVAGVKIPSKVYMGSFLMEPQFRTQFLKIMGNEVIPKAVLDGYLESTVVVYQISEPVETAPGEWELGIVAARFETNDRGEQGEVVIRRRLKLKAIRKQLSALLPKDRKISFRESVRLLMKNQLVIASMVADN